MSNNRVSALEQAFSNLKAREVETLKQLELLTDGFQQLQQLILQQQPLTPPAMSSRLDKPIPDSFLQAPTGGPPPPALPNKFDGD